MPTRKPHPVNSAVMTAEEARKRFHEASERNRAHRKLSFADALRGVNADIEESLERPRSIIYSNIEPVSKAMAGKVVTRLVELGFKVDGFDHNPDTCAAVLVINIPAEESDKS